MSRLMFMVLLLALYGVIDYYIFQAVKVVYSDSSPGLRKIIYTGYWSITILTLVFAGLISGLDGAKHPTLRSFLITGVVINFVSKIFSLLFLFADDLSRATQYAYKYMFQGASNTSAAGTTITRSEFLSKAALVAGAIPASVMSFGMISGAYDYRVRKKQILLPNLPASFDGIRIAQLSDIHSGSFYNKTCLLYTSPSPRDRQKSRMPSSA